MHYHRYRILTLALCGLVAAALVSLALAWTVSALVVPMRFGAGEPLKSEYKFWYIKRDDNGFITEAAIRYYEGAVTTENEVVQLHGVPEPVTKYRRTARLQKADIFDSASKTFVDEANGNDAVVFTTKDFGRIKTEDELRAFLNVDLARDTTRTPIDQERVIAEQKI